MDPARDFPWVNLCFISYSPISSWHICYVSSLVALCFRAGCLICWVCLSSSAAPSQHIRFPPVHATQTPTLCRSMVLSHHYIPHSGYAELLLQPKTSPNIGKHCLPLMANNSHPSFLHTCSLFSFHIFFPFYFQDDENSGLCWNIFYNFIRTKKAKENVISPPRNSLKIFPNTRSCLVPIYVACVVRRNKRSCCSSPHPLAHPQWPLFCQMSISKFLLCIL